MKKGRFLWSAHRITERQKAGKARNIKEKRQSKNFSTVSRQHVVHLSSPRDNLQVRMVCKCSLFGRLQAIFFIFSSKLFGCLCAQKSKPNTKPTLLQNTDQCTSIMGANVYERFDQITEKLRKFTCTWNAYKVPCF